MQELVKLKEVLETAKKEISGILAQSTMTKIRDSQVASSTRTLQEIHAEVELAKKELQMLRNSTSAIREAHEAELRVRESSVKKMESDVRESSSKLKSEAQAMLSEAQKLLSENKKKREFLDEKLEAIKALAQ